jgi:hypothetical protein
MAMAGNNNNVNNIIMAYHNVMSSIISNNVNNGNVNNNIINNVWRNINGVMASIMA